MSRFKKKESQPILPGTNLNPVQSIRMGPTLLDRLEATVEDEQIFPLQHMADKAERIAEFKEIFRRLFDAALVAWKDPIEDENDPDYGFEPAYPGAALFEKFPILGTDWLESFRDAIKIVAAQQGHAGTHYEQFLCFMHGYLMCGWDEHIRRKHHLKNLP
jgi:hypothetical protein